MLAIRDAGLPMPGGIVGLSPWLDLLHSMPSLLTNAFSDYLPEEGFTQGGQGSLRRVAKLASTVHPDDDLLTHPDMPEIQYYASNAVLDCPYVSPLTEKSLEGACPMLVVNMNTILVFRMQLTIDYLLIRSVLSIDATIDRRG